MPNTRTLAAALHVEAPDSAAIAALRARLAISQAELARAAGVHVNTIARAERGELALGAAPWALALLALGAHPVAVAAARLGQVAGRSVPLAVPAGKPVETSVRAGRETRRDLAAGKPSRPRR